MHRERIDREGNQECHQERRVHHRGHQLQQKIQIHQLVLVLHRTDVVRKV